MAGKSDRDKAADDLANAARESGNPEGEQVTAALERFVRSANRDKQSGGDKGDKPQ